MRLIPSMLLCTALVAGGGVCAADPDPLGFYVGAGAGQATLNQDYYQIDAHTTGWKIVAGWHPLSFLGAEIEYADLGSRDVTYENFVQISHISTDARSTGLFAVGYLPVPLPWLGLYGKLGAARVQANTTATINGPCAMCLIGPVRTDTTSTKFAWGAGAEFKFGLPGLRFEYERLNGSQGDDSLLSLAVTLNF